MRLRELDCPNCGAAIEWDGHYGRPVKCPYCGSTFIPAATDMQQVWLMTDPVARARYESDDTLAMLEHDIRYEVMRGGTWLPEELEYKRETRRLLRQGAMADEGTYWFTSPFPTVYRALQDGSLTVAGREYPFREGEDVVFQCRMNRDMNRQLSGPLLVDRLRPTGKARLCGEMGGAMKGM